MINELDVLIRISLAIGCGLLIGLERQITGHLGGIKTNILISLGSCIFVLFSFLVGENVDKTRIAAQVVTGVGFLCSSVIMKNGVSVNGINTSATIWCTSAVGILCSLGMWRISILVTCLLILANLIFYPIAEKIPTLRKFNDEEENNFLLSVRCDDSDIFNLRKYIVDILDETAFVLTGIEINQNEKNYNHQTNIELTLHYSGKQDNSLMENIVTSLCKNEQIFGVNWKML